MLLLLAALALTACGGRRRDEGPWTARELARLSLRERAAQMVAPALPPMIEGDTAAAAQARRWVQADAVGGLVVEGGELRATRALLASLRRLSRRPPLVLMTMEHGTGGVLEGATPFAAPEMLGTASDPDSATAAGTAAGAEGRAAGVDLAVLPGPPLARDASLALIDPRSARAADGWTSFADGLRRGGMAVAWRIFAPGAAHAAVPPERVASWDRAALEAGPLTFARTVVASGADALALSTAVVPALTGDSVPIALSRVAARGVLRRDLGFGGVVMAEVGLGTELARRYGEAGAAVRAVAAGADLVVGVRDPRAVIDALLASASRGEISPARITESARRVFALKASAGVGTARPDSANAAIPAAIRQASDAAARISIDQATFATRNAVALFGTCRAPLVVAPPGLDARPLANVLTAARRRLVPVVVADTVARTGPVLRLDTARVADCLLLPRTRGVPAPTLVARFAAAAGADTTARDTARPPPTVRRVFDVALDATEPAPVAMDAAVLAPVPGAAGLQAAARALTRQAEPAPLPGLWPPAPEVRLAPAESAGMSEAKLAVVDRAIETAIRDGVFPGAALAIGRRGVLVRLRGYGQLSGADDSPPVRAAETQYDLASLTKVVATTSAAMALVDDGLLDLDAPVRRYLPAFTGGNRGDVTVRNLLTHTSGLPAGEDLYSATRSPEAALRRIYAVPLQYEPGTASIYSDFGMILLKEIVERRANEPIDRFLARRLFLPLGMWDTEYRPPLLERERTAPGAIRTERPYVVRGVVHDGNAFRLGGVAGHAGLFSTARDLAVFSQMMLNRGAYGPRRLYAAGTVRRSTMPQGLPGGRGLGWDFPAARSTAGTLFSSASFGHTGFTGTSIWIDPARQIFVVLLTNRTYDRGTAGQILAVRQRVHDAAVLAITDIAITPRRGAVVSPEMRRMLTAQQKAALARARR